MNMLVSAILQHLSVIGLMKTECVLHFLDSKSVEELEVDLEWQHIVHREVSNSASIRVSCIVVLVFYDASNIESNVRELENLQAQHKFLWLEHSRAWEFLEEMANTTHNFDSLVKANSSQDVWYNPRHTSSFTKVDSTNQMANLALTKLRDIPLRMAVSSIPPFAIKKSGGTFVGTDVDVWRLLAEKLNVHMNLVQGRGNSGTVLMVKNKLVAGSVMSLTINENWLSGISVLPNMRRLEITFKAGLPGKKANYLTMFRPFDSFVWIFLVISTALVSAILYCSSRVKPTHDAFPVMSPGFATMLYESLPQKLISLKALISVQLTLFFWLPLSVLISMSYQSNLLASLVREHEEKPVDSYQDVLDRGMTAYTPEETSGPRLLKTSPYKHVRDFYQQAVIDKGGLMRLRDHGGQYAGHMIEEKDDGRAVLLTVDITSEGMIGRVTKDMSVGLFACGFYHQRNHPLMDAARIIHGRINDAGVTQKIINGHVWYYAKIQRDHIRSLVSEMDPVPLTIAHLLPVFLVHFALNALILLVECVKKIK